MKKFLLIISACLSMTTQSGYGSGKERTLQNLQEYQLSFMLPINWSSEGKCNLAVTIPEGYRSLQKESSWQNSSIIEFIPQGEADYEWSEIITINKFIGKKITAEEMISALKSTFERVKGKTWREKSSKEKFYTLAELEASYNFQGKPELVGCRYYSGPNDCVGVQYAIRSKRGQSDEELMKKIQTFLDTNTEIIGCD